MEKDTKIEEIYKITLGNGIDIGVREDSMTGILLFLTSKLSEMKDLRNLSIGEWENNANFNKLAEKRLDKPIKVSKRSYRLLIKFDISNVKLTLEIFIFYKNKMSEAEIILIIQDESRVNADKVISVLEHFKTHKIFREKFDTDFSSFIEIFLKTPPE